MVWRSGEAGIDGASAPETDLLLRVMVDEDALSTGEVSAAPPAV